VAIFEREAWAADALTVNAALDVEVTLPPVVHHVPLAAVRRWQAGPTTNPREQTIKRSMKA
jgi:hypothetical protein